MAERFFGKHTIFDEAGSSRTPYMTRVWIGRLRLHIFYRGDNDPDPHDHPWDFWTFPLTPYVEEVATPDAKGLSYMEALFCGPERYKLHRHVVRAFRLSYRPATHCHRVIGRYSGHDLWDYPGRVRGSEPIPQADGRKIVTIVWRGKPGRKWGFLRNRDGKWCWTPWKEYIFGGGKHAPCEPAATPSSQPNMRVADLTNEQKEMTLLRIIDAMGGRTDSSDYPGNWLTWFCSDEIHNVQEDTFNRCNDKGWLHTTHDTSFDTSTTTLTEAGRAALAAEGPHQ